MEHHANTTARLKAITAAEALEYLIKEYRLDLPAGERVYARDYEGQRFEVVVRRRAEKQELPSPKKPVRQATPWARDLMSRFSYFTTQQKLDLTAAMLELLDEAVNTPPTRLVKVEVK